MNKLFIVEFKVDTGLEKRNEDVIVVASDGKSAVETFHKKISNLFPGSDNTIKVSCVYVLSDFAKMIYMRNGTFWVVNDSKAANSKIVQ